MDPISDRAGFKLLPGGMLQVRKSFAISVVRDQNSTGKESKNEDKMDHLKCGLHSFSAGSSYFGGKSR